MPATLFQTRQLTDNLIINTKLSDMVSQTIKGRVTAGTGDPEDLTSTQVRSILGLSTTDVVQFGNLNSKNFSIAVPTTINDGIDICTITNGNYATCINIDFCVHDSGFAISKKYTFAAFYNDTNNVWFKLVPISSSGAYGGNDCELDIKTSTNTTTIRFRRTAGSGGGTGRFSVSVGGDPSGTTIASSSTTYTAISGLSDYNQTATTTLGGNVGIGIGVPTSKLHVVGTTSTSTLFCPGNNSYINTADDNYLGGVTYFRSKGGGGNKLSIDGPTGNLNSAGAFLVVGNIVSLATVQGAIGYFTGADSTYVGKFSGTSYGLRMLSVASTGFYVEAVDPTFASTYQPLILGGSAITLNQNTTIVGTIKNTSASSALNNGYRAAFGIAARIIGTTAPEFELWHDGQSVGQFKYDTGVLKYGTHGGGGTPSFTMLSVAPTALVFNHYGQSGAIEISTGGIAGTVASPLNMELLFRGYGTPKAKISCPEVSGNYGTTHLAFFVENSSNVLTESLRLARLTGNLLVQTVADAGNSLSVATYGSASTNKKLVYFRQADDSGYTWNLDTSTTGDMFLRAVNTGSENSTPMMTFSRANNNVKIQELIVGSTVKIITSGSGAVLRSSTTNILEVRNSTNTAMGDMYCGRAVVNYLDVEYRNFTLIDPANDEVTTIEIDDGALTVNQTTYGLRTISYVGHTHTLSNLTQSGATSNQVPQWNGSAWVPVTLSSGGLTWTIVTADGAMSPSNGYIANKGTLLTMSLPTTCATGTIIRLSGMNAGLWKISQAAGQSIKFGNQSTTAGTGGYLASVLTYDAVELICIVANTTWMVISSVGNITVV